MKSITLWRVHIWAESTSYGHSTCWYCFVSNLFPFTQIKKNEHAYGVIFLVSRWRHNCNSKWQKTSSLSYQLFPNDFISVFGLRLFCFSACRSLDNCKALKSSWLSSHTWGITSYLGRGKNDSSSLIRKCKKSFISHQWLSAEILLKAFILHNRVNPVTVFLLGPFT